MFFIGIFGIQDKIKVLKEFPNTICKCGSYTRAEMLMEYTYFHFFFIPLFKWNRRHYVQTRCCHRVFKVPEDYVEELLAGDRIDFDRLEEVGGYQGDGSVSCSHCGGRLQPGFEYCPYCGRRI